MYLYFLLIINPLSLFPSIIAHLWRSVGIQYRSHGHKAWKRGQLQAERASLGRTHGNPWRTVPLEQHCSTKRTQILPELNKDVKPLCLSGPLSWGHQWKAADEKPNVLCSMVHGYELTRLSFHSVAQLLEPYCTSKRGPQWDRISSFNSTVPRGLEPMSDSPGPLNLDSYSGLNVSRVKLARVNTFWFYSECRKKCFIKSSQIYPYCLRWSRCIYAS